MKIKHIFITILTLSIVLAGCTNERGLNKEQNEKQSPKGDKQELQVSAAASLTEVSKSLGNEFKKDHPNVEIKFNYGGSGALRQQIEAGAPADVMMSANTKDIDLLKKKNKAHDTYNYAKNQLVLIGDKNKSYTSVKDLNQNDKLALGQIKTVPAGKYAKQYLDDQHLYGDVKDKIIFAKDVKQVLNYVEKEMHRKDSFIKQTYINKRKKQIKLKSSKKLN